MRKPIFPAREQINVRRVRTCRSLSNLRADHRASPRVLSSRRMPPSLVTSRLARSQASGSAQSYVADFDPFGSGRTAIYRTTSSPTAKIDETGLVLEEDVTVGHSAIIHGSRVDKGCLIGMGAVLLSGSVIGAGSLSGRWQRGPRTCKIPPRVSCAGNPAEAKKPLEGGPLDGWPMRRTTMPSSLAVTKEATKCPGSNADHALALPDCN